MVEPWNCRCAPTHGVLANGRVIVYPLCKLISFKGLLMRYPYQTEHIMGAHRFQIATEFILSAYTYQDSWYMRFSLRANNVHHNLGGTINFSVFGAGLQRVRTVQRWWRRQLERRWRERAVAVMMGAHPRLGASSPLRLLDHAVLKMCVE